MIVTLSRIGDAMAVIYRSTAAERQSTPAHLRVVAGREEGALKLRIPKRRGPPLTKDLLLHLPRALCSGSHSNSMPSRSSSSNVRALVPLRS